MKPFPNPSIRLFHGCGPTLFLVLTLGLVWPSFAQEAASGISKEEAAAWHTASSKNTVASYLAFYSSFPQSQHIKVTKGTIRARYWFKLRQPTDNPSQPTRDGVAVTVAGMRAARNLSLKDAEALGVVIAKPVDPDARVDTNGMTFNRVFIEVIGGGMVVDEETISPRDLANATLIISADGKHLLAWDISGSSDDPHPATTPTIVAAEDGQYPCEKACAKP